MSLIKFVVRNKFSSIEAFVTFMRISFQSLQNMVTPFLTCVFLQKVGNISLYDISANTFTLLN